MVAQLKNGRDEHIDVPLSETLVCENARRTKAATNSSCHHRYSQRALKLVAHLGTSHEVLTDIRTQAIKIPEEVRARKAHAQARGPHFRLPLLTQANAGREFLSYPPISLPSHTDTWADSQNALLGNGSRELTRPHWHQSWIAVFYRKLNQHVLNLTVVE